MMREIFPAAAFVALILLTPTAQADQVHARAGEEEGQVILFVDGGACFGLTPQHVMAGSVGGTAALVRRDRVILDGFATEALDLGRDLALVTVRGAVAERCGPPLRDAGDARGRIEAAGGRLAMRHVTSTGMTLFRPVRLLFVGDTHIFFEEAGEGMADWSVAPGDSGSALMLGDEIVGIVQDRGSVHEPPRALLWTYALHLADWRRERRSSADSDAAAVAPSGAAGVRIERTTARARSVDHGPDRLTAPLDEGGFWHAEAVEWPVDLVLALPEIAGVSGLVFHASPPGPVAHPRQVEIFLTRDADGERGWRSYGSATLSPGEDLRVVSFGDGRLARRIRVRIYDTWSPDDEIALGRLEVLLAD